MFIVDLMKAYLPTGTHITVNPIPQQKAGSFAYLLLGLAGAYIALKGSKA